MKISVYLLLLPLFLLQTVRAQETHTKPVIYRANIQLFPSVKTDGYLTSISDSAIYLSYSPQVMRIDLRDVSGLQKFDYKNIQWVSLHRKGSITKGMLIGAISGLVIGTLAGALTPLSELDQIFTPRSSYIISGALVGTALGVGVGAGVGALVKKKFLINGEWKNLEEMKEYLRK